MVRERWLMFANANIVSDERTLKPKHRQRQSLSIRIRFWLGIESDAERHETNKMQCQICAILQNAFLLSKCKRFISIGHDKWPFGRWPKNERENKIFSKTICNCSLYTIRNNHFECYRLFDGIWNHAKFSSSSSLSLSDSKPFSKISIEICAPIKKVGEIK